MGDSHSKGVDSSVCGDDPYNDKGAADTQQHKDSRQPNDDLPAAPSTKYMAPDPPVTSKARNVQDTDQMKIKHTAVDSTDSVILLDKDVTADQVKEQITSAKNKNKLNENVMDNNNMNEEKLTNNEMSNKYEEAKKGDDGNSHQQNSDKRDEKHLSEDVKVVTQSETQKKTASKKWSFRRKSSKKPKTYKPGSSELIINEEESAPQRKELDSASESTQDGREQNKITSKKSSRKTKSPRIFRRKSKSKIVDASDRGTEVTMQEEVKVEIESKKNVADDEVKASDPSLSKAQVSQQKTIVDETSDANIVIAGNEDDQRSRSKSLELQDQKICIYVRDSRVSNDDKQRAVSMKNLKSTRRDIDGKPKNIVASKNNERVGITIKDERKENKQDVVESDVKKAFLGSTVYREPCTVSPAPAKPARSYAQEDGLKSAKLDLATDTQVQVLGSTRATMGSSKPSTVITPAHEAEPPETMEKAQIRQTAMVVVTREVITSGTPPLKPLTVSDYKTAKLSKMSSASYSPLISVRTSIRAAEQKVNSRHLRSAQTYTTASSQKPNFSVIEVKSAAGKEHKLLQVTMQTICQKANKLHKMMTNTETVQARLMAYHKLQLLAIGDKEKELNNAIRRISLALKDEVDKKLGVNLQHVKDWLAECNLQIATFQGIIDGGNKLLESGSLTDVVQKEQELAAHLKVLDKHLHSLQDESLPDEYGKEKIAFNPGTTDNLELRMMFGDLILGNEDDANTDSQARLRQRRPPPQLLWSDNPWIPFFRRHTNTSLTSNELMNARIREEQCFRDVTRIANMICDRNFTGFVLELFECGIDTEIKMKKLCDVIVSLAAGHFHLAHTLALLCRCISSLSVPSDSRKESRHSSRSTVLNFLDRFCMRRYEIRSGTFLATGATPAISRSGSFVAMPTEESRKSSLSAYNTLRGSRTPQPYAGRDYDDWGSGTSTAGNTLKPPSQSVRSGSLKRDADGEDSDNKTELFEENDRRYSNLSLLMFICEVFKLRLSTDNTIHEWLSRLARLDNSESVEAMCFVLFQIGRYLDHKRAHQIVNKIFVQLTYIAARATTGGRLRSMIQDVLELRDNQWITIRKANYWQYLIG